MDCLPITLVLEKFLNDTISGNELSSQSVCEYVNSAFSPNLPGKGSFISAELAEGCVVISIKNFFDGPCAHELIQLEYREDDDSFWYRFLIPIANKDELEDDDMLGLLNTVNSANLELDSTKVSLVEISHANCCLAFELTRENLKACSYSIRFIIGELISFYHDIFVFAELHNLSWVLPVKARNIDEMTDRMRLLLSLGLYLEAVEEANQVLEISAECQEAYYIRAHSHYAMNAIDKSLLDFRKAVDLSPSDFDAINMVGVCMLRNNDFDGALIYFNATLQLDPCNCDALYQRAQAHLGLNDYTSAAIDLRVAESLGDQMAKLKIQELGL